MKIGAAILSILLTVGCTGPQFQPIDTAAFQVGAPKEEIVAAMGPERLKTIGSKRYEDGVVVEVVEITRLDRFYHLTAERYWLYFYDDILEHWGRPGDWRREADKIYEVRMR
jgi:hypothetical protein